MPEERVTLLYAQDYRPDVPALATVIAAVLGTTMVDARRIARYGRGILVEGLDPEKADRLLPALKNTGLDCVAVPTASLPRLPKPTRCVVPDPTGPTFRYRMPFQQDWEHVPWEAIRFLSVGIVATKQFRESMTGSLAGNLPIIYKVEDPEAKAELREAIAKMGTRKLEEAKEAVTPASGEGQAMDAISGALGRLGMLNPAAEAIAKGALGLPTPSERSMSAQEREARERLQEAEKLADFRRNTREKIQKDELDTLYREQTDTCLDLVTIGMSGRYRISRRDVRFDYMGAHAKPTSLENFKTLVEDLLFRIPDVLVSPMTEKYRHMTDVREVVFDTPEEFDRYNTWVWEMAELARQAAPAAPPPETPPPAGAPAP